MEAIRTACVYIELQYLDLIFKINFFIFEYNTDT